ncbi:5-oxoprolinase subunit PxpA [Gillisia sp. M10.2A]|uniref:5-oxoprolinase subunit PxpA n=1 Tax=Gillisia lutea TaxID=2909668 RepID=A0ABS9EIA8_9FLAO|nr:5-oxoprolinase subunit PxpA [Gillisia lutea]MCF4102576.1 5-oxoprolinase subunit PxpA [Gillisia lutea]
MNIHINCDLGEGGDFDAQLMPFISACNIACGGHAGTSKSMYETVCLANLNKVEIGAHPSYPDKENFGRLSLQISKKDLKDSLQHQIFNLQNIVQSQGAKISHFKAHGALYNDAAKDEKIADLLIDFLLEFDDNLPLFVPQNSVIYERGKNKIPMIFEAFADRNYNDDYSLVSRSESHALITQKEEVFKHVYSMIYQHKIICENEREIDCYAGTFCIHSDTPNSVEILQYLTCKLQENNLKIKKG